MKGLTYDVIVIGGGAAGLFSAFTAAHRGKRVLVIEHNHEVGRKIIVSGGGRCNFTNIHTRAENFISKNPHFCKSALAQYTPEDFVSLVKSHKIAFYEKKLGQLFCRDSSRQIVQMLLEECRRSRVTIETSCSVSDVSSTGEHAFAVETNRARFEARNVIVACGGLSFAKIGASDLGYRIAAKFGLKRTDTRPSLVALVAKEKFASLAGVSVDAVAATDNASFRENILFTHRGLSGPAVLQISNYWSPTSPVTIDLCPDIDIEELLRSRSNGVNVAVFLSRFLPDRLARYIVERASLHGKISDLNKTQIQTLVRATKSWELQFIDTEGYDRAEVTLGGVSTDELNSKTMAAKKVPGLYFIGEVVDVTGWLGGYNFQWAWSSAYAAGSAIEK